MAAGGALTVKIAVAKQPLGNTYEIMVVPAESALTTPPVLIVPTARLELLHTPPGVACVRALVPPTHALSVPPIGEGALLTVTTVVT
jgi:hypothetical protein